MRTAGEYSIRREASAPHQQNTALEGTRAANFAWDTARWAPHGRGVLRLGLLLYAIAIPLEIYAAARCAAARQVGLGAYGASGRRCGRLRMRRR